MLERTGLRDEIGGENIFVSIRFRNRLVASHLSLSLRVSPSAIQAGSRPNRRRPRGAGRGNHGAPFTRALSVSSAGEADVRAMLVGSLGCNLAWDIIEEIVQKR